MNFSNTVYLVWEISLAETVMSKHEYIEPEHLLLGICSLNKIHHLIDTNQINLDNNTIESIENEQKEIENIFSKYDISLTSFRRLLRLNIQEGTFEEYGKIIHRSEYSKKLFTKAGELAQKDGLSQFRAVHLLNVILNENLKCVNDTFKLFKIEANELSTTIEEKDFETAPNPNSILDKYGTDLTKLAREGKLNPIIGMEDELLHLVRTLNKREKNNALIIGEAGVGKSSLVRKLAQTIADGKLTGNLNEKTIVEINMGSLVSGTKYRGEFEEKIDALLKEAKNNPNLILFIDEAHTIIGTGSSGSLDASNMIKSALANGEISVIGATTLEEYTLYFEKESAFERRFQPIIIHEPSPETVINILHKIKHKYEEFHNVIISDEAIEAAVMLSVRYIIDRNLPDKALDVIDEACSRKVIPQLNLPSDYKIDTYVTERDVKAVISDWKCIPVIDYSFAIDKLSNIEDFMNERIVGQQEAVTSISNRIKKALIGIQDTDRPLSVFMFLGPKGVGKAHTVNVLSEFLFDASKSIIKLDMSEYGESHTISRLIGSPPGYKGHDEGGFLTNAIKNNPHSIVLIENIEKAHPTIVEFLLQLMNKGEIIDSKNNTINATNCIFIINTNYTRASDNRNDVMYGTVSEDSEIKIDDLNNYFRSDLLDSIDEFVIFNKLKEEDYEILVDRSLEKLSERLLSDKKIEMIYDEKVVKLLAHRAYEKHSGVKYLTKLIEKKIEFPIADLLLERKLSSSNQVIICEIEDQLEFIINT